MLPLAMNRQINQQVPQTNVRKGTYYEKACASTSRRGAEIFQNSRFSAAEATYCGKQPQPRPARVQAPANETRLHEPLVRHNSITFDLSALSGQRPRLCASAQKKRGSQVGGARTPSQAGNNPACQSAACGTKRNRPPPIRRLKKTQDNFLEGLKI